MGTHKIHADLDVDGSATVAGNTVKGYATGTRTINSTSYTMIGTVVGDRLASVVELTLTGTSGNVVIGASFEITVMHSQDIFVKSMNGDYKDVKIKITSDNNEDFSIEAMHTATASDTPLEVCIFPKAGETCVVTGTDPGYNGLEHEHTAFEGTCFSANDNSTTGHKVLVNGELEASTLDISGNADIDGTLNADGLDVDGDADISGTLTIGTTVTPNVYAQNLYITSSGTTGVNRIDNDDSQLYITYGGTSNRALEILNSNGNVEFAADITVSGGDITLGGTGRIQGVDTVSSGTDAANKTYVDNAVSSAGGGDVTLSGAQTFTGVKTFGTTTKLQFRDSAAYINSPAANDIEVAATTITLDASSDIQLEGNTTVTGSLTADQLNLQDMGDYITFYGNDAGQHSISSRDTSGTAADDLRINSYGAVHINLDSNSNNTSGADFTIGHHGSNDGSITNLLTVSGENGDVVLTGDLTFPNSQTLTASSGKIAFNGRVSGSTPTGTTDFTTKAYVDLQVSNLINSAPGALDTLNELAAALGDDASFSTTVTNSIATKLPLAGGTMTGDLILGDNVKLEIGSASGGDLQIYHDGTHSWISDQGAGNLTLLASAFVVNNAADSENMIIASADGSVNLYYNGSQKFRTVSAGVEVTGATTSSDTITSTKSSTHVAQGTFSAANAHLDLYNSLEADTDQKGSIITFTDNYYDGSNYHKTTRAGIKGGTDAAGNTANGYLEFYTDSGAANSPSLALRLDSSQNATFAGDVTVGANKIGRDADNLIDFSTDNQIRFRVNGGDEANMTNGYFYPHSNDGLGLGFGGNAWSDLFLASGAVINFNNGDITLTHSSNNLTFAGGTLVVPSISLGANDHVVEDGALFMDENDNTMITFASGVANITGSSASCTGNAATATKISSITNSNIVQLSTTTTQTGTKTFSGVIDITNTTDSTNATGDTGALRCEGGGSIAKKLYVGSTITGSADVIAFSDKKLKENIETLDGKKVLDMRGVSFTRKDTGAESSGVIAQEIQKVAPELVHDTEGTLGVAYGNLVGYLIEAIKDQQKQIDELKAMCSGCSK